MSQQIAKIFGTFVALTLMLAGSIAAAGYWLHSWWLKPVSLNSPVVMTVAEGSSLQSVSRQFSNQKILDGDARLFEYGWRLFTPRKTVKAGDYRFEGSLSPEQVAQRLATGETISVSFTIPEGWNTFQIAERLTNVFDETTKKDWLNAMRDPRLTKTLPGAPATVEGFLFPETYTFRAKVAPKEVIATMVATFWKNLDKDLVRKGEARNLNLLEVVILASIIEKETGKAEERPHISSVFHNRMRIGMRLQTDPTVIYGMWERFDGNIRKKDLKTPTPYNTYVIPGLPPGPIASPGLAALEAAVNPIETKDLYFVSRGDGSHIFSSNFKDHQRGVYQYQIAPNKKMRSSN